MLASEEEDRGSRAFWAGIALCVCLFVGACLLVASRAFFTDDDFRWLSTVRAPDFSLLDAYFPIESRSWWSYRPISMHSYFFVNQALFGLWPPGFYAVVLSVHFTCGLLTYKLARQLGFGIEVAAFTGVLAITRPPSAEVVFWISAFNYFSVAFFSLLCVVSFGEYLAAAARRSRLLSCGALGAALLCQESAVVLPGVLFALGMFQARSQWLCGAVSPLRRTLAAAIHELRRVWPQVALAGLWAVYRFAVIAPYPRRVNYQSVWGWNVPANMMRYLEWSFDGAAGSLIAGGIVIGTPIALLSRVAGRRILLRWLLPLDAALLAWLVATLLPFSAVRMTAPRFAIAAAIPLCLLVGAQLAALWQLADSRWRPHISLALLALLFAAMPYGTLASGASRPTGALARRIFLQTEALRGDLAVGTGLVLLYGGPGQMSDAWRVRRETWTGTPLVEALYPGLGFSMSFQDMGRDAPARNLAARCRYFELGPNAQLTTASSDVVGTFLRRALSSPKPGAAGLAAQRLVLADGASAIREVGEAARKERGARRWGIAQALLMLDDTNARAVAAELIPEEARRNRLRAALAERWDLAGPR